MSRPAFSLPCVQHPAEVELFIPPPPPPAVFPSIAFQAIFSDCPPPAHKVSFQADVPLSFPTNTLWREAVIWLYPTKRTEETRIRSVIPHGKCHTNASKFFQVRKEKGKNQAAVKIRPDFHKFR